MEEEIVPVDLSHEAKETEKLICVYVLGSRQTLCTHSHGGLIIFSKGDESVFLFVVAQMDLRPFLFCRTNGTDGMCVVNAGSR